VILFLLKRAIKLAVKLAISISFAAVVVYFCGFLNGFQKSKILIFKKRYFYIPKIIIISKNNIIIFRSDILLL
jgi:hypothetical protein